MKLVYSLTLKDFKEAQLLHRKQKFTRQLAVWIWPALLILGILGSLFSLVTNHPELLGDSLALCSGALFVTIMMPICRAYYLRKGFKQLFPPTRTDPSSSLDIDDDRILSGIPGISEGTIQWRGISLFAQNQKITMLYISELRFLFFPTAGLTADQREELERMAERHGVKSHIC